jgi:hypothetical protein
VAAAVRHLEHVGLIDLLGVLNGHAKRLSVAQRTLPAFVDGEFGVDEVSMVIEQIVCAVVRGIRKLFIRRERQNDVTIGLEALLGIFDEVGDEDRRHRLVVDRTTGAEKSVDLLQLERIERPVLAPRFDHVGDQEDRLARPGAAQPRHHVALARPA